MRRWAADSRLFESHKAQRQKAAEGFCCFFVCLRTMRGLYLFPNRRCQQRPQRQIREIWQCSFQNGNPFIGDGTEPQGERGGWPCPGLVNTMPRSLTSSYFIRLPCLEWPPPRAGGCRRSGVKRMAFLFLDHDGIGLKPTGTCDILFYIDKGPARE